MVGCLWRGHGYDHVAAEWRMETPAENLRLLFPGRMIKALKTTVACREAAADCRLDKHLLSDAVKPLIETVWWANHLSHSHTHTHSHLLLFYSLKNYFISFFFKYNYLFLPFANYCCCNFPNVRFIKVKHKGNLIIHSVRVHTPTELPHY